MKWVKIEFDFEWYIMMYEKKEGFWFDLFWLFIGFLFDFEEYVDVGGKEIFSFCDWIVLCCFFLVVYFVYFKNFVFFFNSFD